MKRIFDYYLKHILIAMVAVLFFNFTAISQCTPVLRTSPTLLQGCEDFSVQFFDSTVTDISCIIQTRQWNFGDGSPTTGTQNPVHVYTAGVLGDTTYTATLRIQDQFDVWTQQTVAINVFKKPFVDFELSKDTICAFNETFCTSNISESGPGYEFRWDFETGVSQSYDTCYIFDADGDYTIRLNVTDNQGCISSAERNIAVNEIPNPDFTISPFSGCNPLNATFENTTLEGTFPITGWAWDFDGYGTSPLEEPASVNFPDPGLFTIRLSATNSAGCTNTTENNFLVRETPTADFNFDPEACVDENVTFVYSGTATALADYRWTFESATIASDIGQGPKLNAWSTGGEFQISLIVTENACSDTLAQPIKINDLPIVTLESDAPGDSVCELELITFTALPDSFVTYQFMNLGVTLQDSSSNTFAIDTLRSPNEITVVAVDSNNCASTASSNLEITVLPKPFISLTSSDINDTICRGESITFIGSGTFDSYEFFDGFLSLQNSTSSSYNTMELEEDNGIYVIATDLGCEGFPSNTIRTEVVAPLKIPTLNCGESTTNSVSWIWESIDDALGYEISINGGPFESPNSGMLSHLQTGMFFGDSAVAVVHALGQDPCGNSLETDTVKCYAIPCEEIGFTPLGEEIYCAGDTLTIGVDNINTQGIYRLEFNDSIYTDSSLSFITSMDTLVTAKLTDLTQPGCPIFKYDFNITVNPIPDFNLLISLDTVCLKDEIIISSDSAGFASYNFSVNGTEVLDSAYHILTTNFDTDLDKEIVLTATEKGCSNSDTANVYVVPTPPNDISLSSTEICEGEKVTFSGTPGYDRYTFTRLIGTGFFDILDSTINEVEVTSREPENIIISLVAYDKNACQSLNVIDTAFVTPTPTITIASTPDSLCNGGILNIEVNTSIYTTYKLYENFYEINENDSGNFEVPDPINGKLYAVQPIEKGCVGPFSNQIEAKVKDSLDIPNIYCGTTGGGVITFFWDPVENSDGYNVEFRTPTGPVSFTSPLDLSNSITGLTAGDTVWAQVRALSTGPCGPTAFSNEVYCIMPCAGVTFDIDPFTDEVCEGDTVELSISSINVSPENYLISWNGGPLGKLTADTLTSLVSGPNTIRISVSDTTQPHCPPTEKDLKIKVNAYPVVSISGPSEICGDTAILFAASPRSYDSYAFFDGFVKIQDSINPEVIDFDLENGHTYRVVATNNGCADTSNGITISVSDPLEIPDVFCGASGLDSIELRWDSVPKASGYQISINGFPWTTPNGDFKHLISGTDPEDTVSFAIRAIGALPCGNSLRSDQIRCVAKPCHFKDFEFLRDTLICEGDSIDLYASKTNSVSTNRGFSFDFGTTYSKDSLLRVSPSTKTSYSLYMIDSAELQCPFVEKKVIVDVHPIPVFVLENSTENDTVCEGEIIIFTADTAGFDIYETYINDILVLDTNYFEFRTDSLGTGVQKIYMTTYDDVCFFTSDTQEINVVSFPELLLTTSDSDLEICAEDTIEFSANAGFDSYNYYQVLGTDTTLIQSGPDSIYTSNSLIDNSTIFVEGSNASACAKTTASFNFKVNPIPEPVLTSSDIDDIICGLDTLTFTVSPDTLDDYQFFNNDELVEFGGHVYVTDSLRPGNNIYVFATEDGCSNITDTISTSVEFTPEITTGSDTNEICVGDQIRLWVSGGDEKLWSTGETTDTILVTPSPDTDYWVNGITGNCTSPSDTFNIDIDEDIPTPFAGEDTTICIEDSIELEAFGGFTYKWYPTDSVADSTADFTFTKFTTSQTITLEAKTTHCIRTDSVRISIDLCLEELPDGIPNGLTPNGDGTNDSWDIPYIWYFENNSVKIYNRWSNSVYDAAPYKGDWEGTNRNGNPLPDGTYFYVLDLGNGKQPYTGFIVIHR